MKQIGSTHRQLRSFFGRFGMTLMAIAWATVSMAQLSETTHAQGDASARTHYQVLYSFPLQYGPAGSVPYAYVIPDAAGNLYGTTTIGGRGADGGCPCGVVFEVDKTGKQTVLHSLDGATEGQDPWAALIRDSEGNFYGTAIQGGPAGLGSAFKLDKTGTVTVLHAFTGGEDGIYPVSALVRDAAGNLYGTTLGCGVYGGGCGDLWGKVFKVDTNGKETVLHTFSGGADGSVPMAGLIRDGAGNLYGTTSGGGASGSGGVVYKVDRTGKFSVLHSFSGADGIGPYMGHLILDPAGSLYGTTQVGGAFASGVVFKVDPTGKETVLYNFKGGEDFGHPTMPLVRDAAGNLYGTTYYGGGYYACGGQAGCGTVFKVDTNGKETVLHRFRSGTDGANPLQGLVVDSAGNLYGTTQWGGDPNVQCGNTTTGCGAVFKLSLN